MVIIGCHRRTDFALAALSDAARCAAVSSRGLSTSRRLSLTGSSVPGLAIQISECTVSTKISVSFLLLYYAVL